MGRHQITSGHVRKDEGHKVELLGWGLFLTAVAAAGMTYIGLPAGVIFLIAALGLAAFVLLWVFTQLQEDRIAHSRPAARQTVPAPQSVQPPALPAPPAPPAPIPAIAASTTTAVTTTPATPEGPAAPARSAAPAATAGAGPQLYSERRLHPTPSTRREARATAQLDAARSGAHQVRAARAYETSPAASSWTKTFGAPDTGPIPIQPYTGQDNAATAVRKHGKHQMSHSRL